MSPKNKLKNQKLLQNHADIYHLEFDDFSRLTFFNSLSKEDIRYLITKYKIDLTVEEFENLKLIYKKSFPTILELKVLAKYWKTSLSLVSAHINKIEIKSGSNKINDTLKKINILRKKQNKSNILSLNEIFNLYDKNLEQKKIKSLNMSDNLQALSCSAYTPKGKKTYSLNSFTSYETLDNNSLYKAMIKGYEHEFDLMFSFRFDLNKSLLENYIEYGFKSSNAWISSVSISSKLEENKMNVFDVSTIIGFADKSKIHHFNLSNNDKILLIRLNNEKNDLLNVLNLSMNCFFKKHNSFAVINDYSLFFNLTNITKSFNININLLKKQNIDLDEFLFSEQLKYIAVIVKEKHITELLSAAKIKNLDIFEIGQIKDNNYYEMFLNGNKVFSIYNELLHNKPKQNNVAIIDEDMSYDAIHSMLGINFKETALKDLKTLNTDCDSVALNSYLSGNTIVGPYLGETQATTSQAFSIYPNYFKIKDFKVGIAFSESDKQINFIKTISTLTTTLLKIITKGYPIHQVVLEVFLFNNKNDKPKEIGEFLSTALACYEFQNLTSIPVFKPKFKFLDSPSENSYLYVNGYGYTNGKIVNNVFKQGDKIFRLSIEKDSDGLSDFNKILKLSSTITMNIEVGNITAASYVEKNIINTIIINTLNANLGFSFSIMDKSFLHSDSFEILLAIKDVSEITAFDLDYIGVVDGSGVIRFANFQITNSEILKQLNKKTLTKLESTKKTENKNVPKIIPKIKKSKSNALIISFDRCSISIYSNILTSIGFNVKEKLLAPNFVITDSLIRDLRDSITKSNIILITGDIPNENLKYYNHLINIIRTPSVLDAINQALHSYNALIFASGVGAKILFQLGFIEMGNSEEKPKFSNFNQVETPLNKLFRFSLINKNNLWLKNTTINCCNCSISSKNNHFKLPLIEIEKMLKNGQIIAQYNYDKFAISSNQKNIKDFMDLSPVGITSPKGNICGFLPSIEKCIHTSTENYLLLVEMFTNAYNYLD